jgi:hypothetical protein
MHLHRSAGPGGIASLDPVDDLAMLSIADLKGLKG